MCSIAGIHIFPYKNHNLGLSRFSGVHNGEIGRLIVKDEQQGEIRAAYGKQQLRYLSRQLTYQFGKGFDVTNLRNMRCFYLAFPNRETLSLELSWSHYSTLARLDNPNARQWYMVAAAQQHWSVRVLDRQISKLYYERLLNTVSRPFGLQA